MRHAIALEEGTTRSAGGNGRRHVFGIAFGPAQRPDPAAERNNAFGSALQRPDSRISHRVGAAFDQARIGGRYGRVEIGSKYFIEMMNLCGKSVATEVAGQAVGSFLRLFQDRGNIGPDNIQVTERGCRGKADAGRTVGGAGPKGERYGEGENTWGRI